MNTHQATVGQAWSALLWLIVLSSCLFLLECGAARPVPSDRSVEPTTAGTKNHSTKRDASSGREGKRPAGLLSRHEAERYVLDLINRDRKAEGLSAVEWDSTAARAGNEHAIDMAANGYTAHIGTTGSTPESRYSEAGGIDMVQENSGCYADAKRRDLDDSPMFDSAAIEKVQDAFMSEKPPHDGHRKNILRPWHTHVGVGLAKAKGFSTACMAQEFVDRYGEYEAIPKQAKVGQKIRVAGTVRSPAKFVGVGIARVDAPTPQDPQTLLRSGSYPIPPPFVNYFPKGFVTPMPVQVSGNDFVIEVPLSDNTRTPASGRSGVYEVSVWGQVPGTKDFVMISLRTVRVK